METMPAEVVSSILCAVVDDRDFLACLCTARLFSVCSRADVLERQCRRCRSVAAAARRLPTDALDHFWRTRKMALDSAAVYAAASAGRADNVRWLHEHTDAPHRPGVVGGAVACGPRILSAAVRSGSTATVACLIAQGYRISMHAFTAAAGMGRVDLLRMLDAASPDGDMMHVARTAIINDRSDAFIFAAERLGTLTRDRTRYLFGYAVDDRARRSRHAHFALLLVERGMLDPAALTIALQVAQCGADIPDTRTRLERAVAALCAGRPHDRRVALGCLPLGVAVGVDDPALLHRAPDRVATETLMRRCAERIVPLDKATDMARVLWADAAVASEELIASVALWFVDGGDLAGAAAIGWIFATSHLPHAQCLEGVSIADVFAFVLTHCKGHMNRRACFGRIMASDDVDLLRLFLDNIGHNDNDGISAVEQDQVRGAACRGNIGVLRLLAECGYGPWPDYLVTSAVQSRRLDVVQFVCDLGAAADHAAIVRAVQLGCDDIVAFLCDRGTECPRMAMRVAIVDNRSDIVRLLRDRKDVAVCRGGARCCEADPVSVDISHEQMDVDALFAYCGDVCSGWRALRDAAGFRNGDLFRRIVAEHQHDDDDIRYALAGSLEAADRRAIRRIIAHFGDRLVSMEWPTRLVDLCQSGGVPLASMDVLADCAPYLCTPEDVVRRAYLCPECNIDGECTAENDFRRMLCARLSRDAMDTT